MSFADRAAAVAARMDSRMGFQAVTITTFTQSAGTGVDPGAPTETAYTSRGMVTDGSAFFERTRTEREGDLMVWVSRADMSPADVEPGVGSRVVIAGITSTVKKVHIDGLALRYLLDCART